MSQTLPSLHRESLEITLTVPILKPFWYENVYSYCDLNVHENVYSYCDSNVHENVYSYGDSNVHENVYSYGDSNVLFYKLTFTFGPIS